MGNIDLHHILWLTRNPRLGSRPPCTFFAYANLRLFRPPIRLKSNKTGDKDDNEGDSNGIGDNKHEYHGQVFAGLAKVISRSGTKEKPQLRLLWLLANSLSMNPPAQAFAAFYNSQPGESTRVIVTLTTRLPLEPWPSRFKSTRE